MICALFTGQPVRRVFLCVKVMSLKENVLNSGENKMDATCAIQDSIHVFNLVHKYVPGFWVHTDSSTYIAAKPVLISSRMSSMFSRPTESLIIPPSIPAATSCSSVS